MVLSKSKHTVLNFMSKNLLKFNGVKLPGGIEMNGRQIYDDAEKDLEIIREMMSSTYELPPLDMIG